MSSKRLNKRQLREQQELEELAQAQQASNPQEPSAQHEDDRNDLRGGLDQAPDPTQKGQKNPGSKTSKPSGSASLFAALGGQDQDDPDDDDDDEQDEEEGQQNDISTAQPAKKGSGKKKKKKKKAVGAAGAAEEDQEGHDAVAATTDKTDEGRDSVAPSDATTVRPAASKRKPNKKRTGATGAGSSGVNAAAKGKDVDDMSMEELNALLESEAKANAAAAAAEGGEGQRAGGAAASGSLRPVNVSALRTHLALDPRSLDPTVELRRQFGSAAIKAFENESSASGGASAGARARAQATNSNLKLRSLLCQPKDYWPPIGRTFVGMSMELHDTPASGRVCTWLHSKAYRQVQLQFLQAVRSYDPNSLMALLRVYPWHIDTLLQLSDYSRHQGDLGQAADFNSRALFAFERSASPYFVSCLSSSTSGPPVVDFHRIENRAFFLAVHRNIGFLGRRGTWRTALEWSKILLGLGRDGEDHHAALLWIDFLAIKAKQPRWLVELCEKLDAQRGARRDGGVRTVEELVVRAETCLDAERADAGEGDGCRGTLDWCVGLQYARALAYRAIEREEKDTSGRRSSAALRLAMARYPMVVPLLASKIGLDLPGSVVTHPLFRVQPRFSPPGAGGVAEATGGDSLAHLLAQIYVHRSESLWRETEVSAWLAATVVALAPALVADYDAGSGGRRRAACADTVTRQGVYRHVLVSDLPDAVRQQLVGYLPPEVTGDGEMMDAFDPVPPAAGDGREVTRYDEAYFSAVVGSGAEGRGERGRGGEVGVAAGGDEGGLMQAFVRALQGVGGLRGWNEAMQDMDDETREDVMAQILEMTREARVERGGEADEVPGGFGADRGGEGDDAAVDGGQGGGGGAFAALRNALNAVWGVGGTASAAAAEGDGGEWEDDDNDDDDDDDGDEEDGQGER